MLQLPIHIDEIPEYEPRGDCILIRWHGLELFVPIPICRAAVGRCKKALDEWEHRSADIIPLRTSIAAE